MRAEVFVASALLCAALLCRPALAADYGAGEVESALPREAREILGDVGAEDALEPEGMFSRLGEAALEKLGSLWRPAARSAAELVAVALLCSAVSALTEGRAGSTSCWAECWPRRASPWGTREPSSPPGRRRWARSASSPTRCCPRSPPPRRPGEP